MAVTAAQEAAANALARESMNVVIVGHVDHGKSTLVGRLLADTGTLGDGKLEKVQATCRRQGKVFEYAFLLDALEEEQGQGITIDAARVFFKSAQRDYIIIDAPGHIEFLKNMVTGAARAEAAILLIDAKEGVRENSRRHGYLMSMLGIKQICVAVNKIDLVGYSQAAFDAIVREYSAFLAEVGITARHFVPMCARDGEMIVARSPRLDWYKGPTVLEAFDGFAKQLADERLPLRMPVQDVYKWNTRGDDHRIVAGRIEAGTLKVGDKVVFSPSQKTATIRSVERWSAPATEAAHAGQSIGVTLDHEIFVGRGELMSHVDTAPAQSTRLRVNLFWLGKKPMQPGKRYKLKLATAEREVVIDQVHRVLDASNLDATNTKERVERHDVADLTLRTRTAVAFDRTGEIVPTSRFVIVDGFDIAGGGIVRDRVADDEGDEPRADHGPEIDWISGDVPLERRAQAAGHPAALVLFVGALGTGKHVIARQLEAALVESNHRAYLLDGHNPFRGTPGAAEQTEVVHRYVEVAQVLLDAGTLVISTNNVIGLAEHGPIVGRVAPHATLTIRLGAEVPGSPTDLRFEANTEPSVAIPAILEALGRRELTRRR
jgi:bifunctional enzyme CysN/CysC